MYKYIGSTIGVRLQAKVMVAGGITVALIALTSLVGCGWVDGFGHPPSPILPPQGSMGPGMEAPDLPSPEMDSGEPMINVSLWANLLENGEILWWATWTGGESPYSIEWDFGGGATNIPASPAISPASVTIEINGTGPYTCQATVTDAQGLFGSATRQYGLDYPNPDPENGEIVDDRIYAYYEKGQASAGEEILVTVTTGKLAHPFQFMLGVGLVMDEDAQYVRNSFNVGSPGGERDYPDGIWADVNPVSFALGPDALIIPGNNPEDSLGMKKRFDFNISPFNPILGPGEDIIGGQGDLFNLRFKYSVPGLKTLAFQRSNGVNRTYYMGAWDNAWDNSDRFWDDVSNLNPGLQTSIVVE